MKVNDLFKEKWVCKSSGTKVSIGTHVFVKKNDRNLYDIYYQKK